MHELIAYFLVELLFQVYILLKSLAYCPICKNNLNIYLVASRNIVAPSQSSPPSQAPAREASRERLVLTAAAWGSSWKMSSLNLARLMLLWLNLGQSHQ